MIDMSVDIAGVTLRNPVILASGCCGFGQDYMELYPLSAVGGISLKGMTREPRRGNPPPRIAETAGGLMNSVGLQNPGVEQFLAEELPLLEGCDTVLIANVAGNTVEDYCALTERLCADAPQIAMIELNISCPNVKHGGAAFGMSCAGAAEVVRAVRARCTKPLMVKLTPNVTDIGEIAAAVESEGADAVSLINTIMGMQIDIDTGRPVFRNNIAGLSGPAVFPVALRMVWQTASRVKIPIVGLGGIERWQDAAQMMLAGASAVQVGSALMNNPMAPIEIVQGLALWLEHRGAASIADVVGGVRPWQ